MISYGAGLHSCQLGAAWKLALQLNEMLQRLVRIEELSCLYIPWRYFFFGVIFFCVFNLVVFLNGNFLYVKFFGGILLFLKDLPSILKQIYLFWGGSRVISRRFNLALYNEDVSFLEFTKTIIFRGQKRSLCENKPLKQVLG